MQKSQSTANLAQTFQTPQAIQGVTNKSSSFRQRAQSINTRGQAPSSVHGILKKPKSQGVANSSFMPTASPFSPAPMRPTPQPGTAPNGMATPGSKPTSPAPVQQERATPTPTGPNGSIAAQTVSSKDPKAAAQAASDMRNVVRRKLTGYVGFANLPNQWHRKSVRKGFNFNVMVVGKFYYGMHSL